jgi:hypothetical protein
LDDSLNSGESSKQAFGKSTKSLLRIFAGAAFFVKSGKASPPSRGHAFRNDAYKSKVSGIVAVTLNL